MNYNSKPFNPFTSQNIGMSNPVRKSVGFMNQELVAQERNSWDTDVPDCESFYDYVTTVSDENGIQINFILKSNNEDDCIEHEGKFRDNHRHALSHDMNPKVLIKFKNEFFKYVFKFSLTTDVKEKIYNFLEGVYNEDEIVKLELDYPEDFPLCINYARYDKCYHFKCAHRGENGEMVNAMTVFGLKSEKVFDAFLQFYQYIDSNNIV